MQMTGLIDFLWFSYLFDAVLDILLSIKFSVAIDNCKIHALFTFNSALCDFHYFYRVNFLYMSINKLCVNSG